VPSARPRPLVSPSFLTSDDLLVATRVLLGRYQNVQSGFIWNTRRRLDNATVRNRWNRLADNRVDTDLCQEVVLAFCCTRPLHVMRDLHFMGLNANDSDQPDGPVATSDDDLYAGLLLLDRPGWYDTMTSNQMTPSQVVSLIEVLGEETVGLGLELGLDATWFTAAEADPTTVDLPGLRTLAALHPAFTPAVTATAGTSQRLAASR
jgi:hypothetical protein